MAGVPRADIPMGDLPSRDFIRRNSGSSQGTLESWAGPQEPERPEEESHDGDDAESLPLAIRVEAHRDLSWLDVAALIVNKTVGTGIFTGPASALLYTQNKQTVIVLWLLGFVYTVTRSV